MVNCAIISSKASLLVSSMQDLQVIDFAVFQIFLSCHYLKKTCSETEAIWNVNFVLF